MLGLSLDDALNFDDFRQAARRRLPRGVFAYVDGGAEDQNAIGRIRAAWDAVLFEPDSLTDVSTRVQQVEIFGRTQPMPCIVAPTAMAGLVWFDGEVELARAAAAAEVPYCVSTQSITSVEDIAARAGGRLWFQLYVLRDRSLTLSFVDRARQAGAEALVVTIDTQTTPKREYNIRNDFGMPIRPTVRNAIDVLSHPRWAWSVLFRLWRTSGMPSYAHYPAAFRASVTRPADHERLRLSPAVTWDDLRELRRRWDGPLVLKGVLGRDVARRALDMGMDGIVVSNHGGRNLDSGVTVAEVLPQISEAVGHKMVVLADSGIRRGSDIVKATALGARATLLGRSALYGLASFGCPGAESMLRILRDEIDTTLAFIGCPDLGRARARVVEPDRRRLDPALRRAPDA